MRSDTHQMSLNMNKDTEAQCNKGMPAGCVDEALCERH